MHCRSAAIVALEHGARHAEAGQLPHRGLGAAELGLGDGGGRGVDLLDDVAIVVHALLGDLRIDQYSSHSSPNPPKRASRLAASAPRWRGADSRSEAVG